MSTYNIIMFSWRNNKKLKSSICSLDHKLFLLKIIFLLRIQGKNYFFVCDEVLWPSQPNEVMLSTISLPNHTFTGQA